jgi:hypothetical protein
MCGLPQTIDLDLLVRKERAPVGPGHLEHLVPDLDVAVILAGLDRELVRDGVAGGKACNRLSGGENAADTLRVCREVRYRQRVTDHALVATLLQHAEQDVLRIDELLDDVRVLVLLLHQCSERSER